jgi:hypothetical protein
MKEKIKNLFKDAFKSEESRFVIVTAFKILCVPVISLILISFIYGIFLKFDHIYFESSGFFDFKQFKDVYYDFIFSKVLYLVPYIFVFIISVFFLGMYLAILLLRPFKEIADHCQNISENKKSEYNPKYVRDFRLLTDFCDYFFHYIHEATISKRLYPKKIPLKYSRIHRPIFDKVFFIHYATFILLVSFVASILLYIISVEFHSQIVDLSINYLKVNNSQLSNFMIKQLYFVNQLVYYSLAFLNLICIFMAINIYNSISTPSFAVFSTLRAFLKGNHSARVHVIGFGYVRSMTRMINKSLSDIEKKYT